MCMWGTNLAIDVYLPAVGGKPVDGRFPALLQVTRYKRRNISGVLITDAIENWVKRGYVVAVLDPRGTGDSFGSRAHDWSREEALDTKEVIERLGRQPYCNGKVGMWGVSYMGGAQLMAASTRPAHLVSLIPVVTTIDQYMRHMNGVTLDMTEPNELSRKQDLTIGTPVDADPNGVMAKAAVEEHKANRYLSDMWPPGKMLFRNDYVEAIKDMPSIVASPITYKEEIKASKVAIYNIGGWFDQAPAQQLGAWRLWGGKILIGPWDHRGTATNDITRKEHLRWFDYTLKGIKNGIDKEPPIYHYTINAPKGKEWKYAWQWPLPNQKIMRFYFGPGPTGTSGSKNDGSLSLSCPKGYGLKDDYRVDYSIRYFDGKFRENARSWDGDMEKGTDSKGLTYTCPPLEEDIEMTGHPVVHLWISSTSKDGYFFVFLEEVDGKTNVSRYVTNGMIRASMRALHRQSPWTEMGIPYHRCYDIDYKPLQPGEIVELAFDLYPISYVFRKGNRIRVTVTCAFQDLYKQIPEDPPPAVSVYRNSTYASYIELPLIRGRK